MPAMTPTIGARSAAGSHSRMALLVTDLGPEMTAIEIPPELPADRHPAAVYLARLAPGSRRTMRQSLACIASALSSGACTIETFDWASLRYQHTQAIRTMLAERYRPATANKGLSALRGVLREAWRLGQLPADPYRRAVDLEAIKGETLPAGRALTAGELRALLAACAADPGPAGARDAALLALLYGAGLRRSEAVALDLADHDQGTGALTVRHTKGHRERIVYAANGTADALADWIEARGNEPGPLFLPVNKGGRIGVDRLTGQAVMGILRRRARAANVANVRPHDLRRTFVSDLLDAGADISTVGRLAGHAQLQTTARYDRRPEAAKRRAVELLHVPYARRLPTPGSAGVAPSRPEAPVG